MTDFLPWEGEEFWTYADHEEVKAIMGNRGGGEVHHYHTVQVVPPAVQQQLAEQKVQLDQFVAEAKERGDPAIYHNNAQKLFGTFVAGVDKLLLTECIKKNKGEKHVAVVGPTSSGKTTLINAVMGTHLPIALGHCTEGAKVVHVGADGLVVWDVCGKNDDYAFYKPENLSFIRDLDVVVVAFDNDIAMIANMLTLIHKLNPKGLVIVRTKVDQYTTAHVRTIQEERKRDMEQVRALLGDVERQTLCVSSHNATALPRCETWDGERRDWTTLQAALQSVQG